MKMKLEYRRLPEPESLVHTCWRVRAGWQLVADTLWQEYVEGLT